MLDAADIARYRAMTPAQRLEEYRCLMAMVWRAWSTLSDAEVQRRLDASAEINDRSNRAMLEYLRAHDH